MKKIITIVLFLSLLVVPVRAQTERECTTDSYGRTTCTEKTTNVRTGEIKYSDGVQNVEILNTSVSSSIALLTGSLVFIGLASSYLKKKIQ